MRQVVAGVKQIRALRALIARRCIEERRVVSQWNDTATRAVDPEEALQVFRVSFVGDAQQRRTADHAAPERRVEGRGSPAHERREAQRNQIVHGEDIPCRAHRGRERRHEMHQARPQASDLERQRNLLGQTKMLAPPHLRKAQIRGGRRHARKQLADVTPRPDRHAARSTRVKRNVDHERNSR